MTHRCLVFAFGLSVLVAGCSGERPSTTGAAVDGSVALVGNDRLEFVPNDITADSGELEIELTCDGSAPHTVVIEETDELVAECRGGTTGAGEVTLEPGTYSFFCSVPGHLRGGMEGTLTVEG